MKEQVLYDGQPFIYHKTNKTNIFRLYCQYQGYKNKCNNKFNPQFKSYGAHGTEMRLTFAEYLTEARLLSSTLNIPMTEIVVCRIDTKGHFEVNNLSAVLTGENLGKRILNCGARPLAVLDFKTGEVLVMAITLTEAAIYANVSNSRVGEILEGYIKQACGFSFRDLTQAEKDKHFPVEVYRGI